MYQLTSGGQSEAERIGDALGRPGAPLDIRELLYSGAPLDEAFILGVAQGRGITAAEGIATLLTFRGRSLRRFSNDAFCGGIILKLGGRTDGLGVHAEAPMAFQSALAGIMLAAELILDAGALRSEGDFAVRTVIDLLRPLGPYLNPPLGRREDDRCFCQDPEYLRAFGEKYGSGWSIIRDHGHKKSSATSNC